jgi:flagellin
VAVTLGKNIASIRAQRALGDATSELSTIYERLSSGQRINRASDDAASLAIADSLKVGKRLFSQAVRNINDGIGALQIADSALGSSANILGRLSELAEQSANGTLNSTQRSTLQKEYSALRNELYRIAETTEFNGVRLLQEELGIDLQVGIRGDRNSRITSSGIDLSGGQWIFDLDKVGLGIDTNNDGLFPDPGDDPRDIFGGSSFATTEEGLRQTFNGNMVEVEVVDSTGATRKVLLGLWQPESGVFALMAFAQSEAGVDQFIGTNETGAAYQNVAAGGTAAQAAASSGIGLFTIDPATGRPNLGSVQLNLDLGLEPFFTGLTQNQERLANQTVTVDLSNLSIRAGQQRTDDVSTFDLLGIGSATSSRQALESVGDKLEEFSRLRGKLGADQSRLAASLSLAAAIGLTFGEAESRLRDADVASESARLIRTQILQQAGAQVLAQANQQPQLALALLRG